MASALVFGGIVVAEKHHRPAGPDAFLDYQVDSTSELVAALRSDPALRRRYARHFGVSESEVIEFVKNALVPYELPRARTVTTYGVTRSGRIYAARTRLRKGTKVWATRSGEPILKWLCANPLTKRLPGVRLARKPRSAKPRVTQRGVKSGAPLAPIAAAEVTPLTETAPFLSMPPVVASALTTPSAPLSAVSAAAPALPAGGGGFDSRFLIPLGLILGITGSGGSSEGTGNAVSPELPPVPVAPEPGTLALTAGALSFVGFVLRRRRWTKEGGTDGTG